MKAPLFSVWVHTPDRDLPVEPRWGFAPIARPLEQAEGIARQMAEQAKRSGWRLSYFVKEEKGGVAK